MAYGLRYTFNFLSDNGKDVVINISEDGYSGSSLLRNVGGSPQLRMEKGDCIRGMSLEIPAECIVEDEYADLYTSNPYKYLVELEVDSSPVWKGFITPELYSAPWIDPPYDVLLTATDGLGELKMHNYPSLGRQSLEALLSTLLGATGLNLPLKMISTAETDIAESTYVLADSSVNLDALAGETYYDVLQKLLTSLHATIQQRNGAWLLIRETDINSMTSGDFVLDTAGAPYAITDFGSMQDYNVWPVGQLRMEIVPAKNRVQVSAANSFIESLLADPDMTEGGWSGDGTHYTSDGGFYALERGQIICQDFIPDTLETNDYPDYFEWKIKYRQSGYAEAVLNIAVEATGIEQDTNQPIVVSWIGVDSGRNGYWSEGSHKMRIEVGKASYGNSSDCTEATISIKIFGGLTSWLSRIDRVRFYFLSQSNTIYIHHSSVSSTSTIEGVNTTLILNNNARGASGIIEPAFADTYIGNHGLAFMWNAVYGNHGSNYWLVDTWKSDILPALPYGEWLAKDNALSVANPRLRLQGRLNVVDYLPALFYRTQEIAYIAEEWAFDLLKDEADISLISMPASSIQVTSVKQTAFNEEGEMVDSAVTVLPSSFIIEAGDSTTRYYMAISAPEGLAWTVTGVPNWIVMSDEDKSGTGSDTISFVPTANAGAMRQAIMIVAGVPVSIYQAGIGTEYPLTIGFNPSDATMVLTVDGDTVEYRQGGVMVASGATVVITVSKSGMGTVTDTFTMPSQATDKFYTLVESIEATVSYNGNISSAAQRIVFHISDPTSHGWEFNWGWLDTYGYMTENGVTSGYVTTINDDGAIGVGDAQIYVGIAANSNANDRTLSNSSLYFRDSTTLTKTYLDIEQLGTGSSQVLVTSISLNKNSLSLAAGASETLTATVSPNNATNKSLSWVSSNANVAVVSQSGKVTAAGAGTCTVSAYSTDGSNKYASCSVTVTGGGASVTGVTLNKASIVLGTGETETLTATVIPSQAANKSVVWSSEDPLTATVSSSGVVTAVKVGTTNVTVMTVDGNKTASCSVTVTANGSMSIENTTVKSIATSASAKFTQASSLTVAGTVEDTNFTVTENVGWITAASVDTSGTPYRVRLTIGQNTSTAAREATVTVTGKDLANNTITATFKLTQNGKTPSDYPCTSMEIGGPDTIANSTNQADYTAAFNPPGTLQAQVGQWSVISGGTNITYSPNGNSCTVMVKPGVTNQTVVLKAKNYYNSVYATKTITVSYITPSANLTVSPGSVTVHATDTSDNTPTVTATDITSGSLQVKSVSGFITSASISNGKLVTAFSTNTGSTERSGSVTVSALDLNSNEVTAVVNYTQAGTGAGTISIAVSKLNVAQTGGKVTARMEIAYQNQGLTDITFGSQSYTLKGYDGTTEVFTRTGSLADKTCAGLTTEKQIYTEQWTGTIGMSDNYVLTFYASGLTATYEGDGDDIIDL